MFVNIFSCNNDLAAARAAVWEQILLRKEWLPP
jgi:hypothetical protein